MAEYQNKIRCPIHGLIPLSDWELRLINHRVFQRLRNIRQLGWTDHVYPGATHTRFEHSIGVMHIAGLLFDAIAKNSPEVLCDYLHFNPMGLARARQLVRIAALLHDVGHSPFSHGSESLFPTIARRQEVLEFDLSPLNKPKPAVIDPTGIYTHEDYSYALIRHTLREAIEDDEINKANYHIAAEEVAGVLQGSSKGGVYLFWRPLFSGQIDADRMDYLLRDSHHAGVNYGTFDLHRVVSTMCIVQDAGREDKAPRIGILEGGRFAVESLIMARYWMFKQVYRHKTRLAYDIHLEFALKSILPEGVFPRPDQETLEQYLKWDDIRALSLFGETDNEHIRALNSRDHYRQVYISSDAPRDFPDSQRIAAELETVRNALQPLSPIVKTTASKWYKMEDDDIQVVSDSDSDIILPLSKYSSVLKAMPTIPQTVIFVRAEMKDQAAAVIKRATSGKMLPSSFVMGKEVKINANESA